MFSHHELILLQAIEARDTTRTAEPTPVRRRRLRRLRGLGWPVTLTLVPRTACKNPIREEP